MVRRTAWMLALVLACSGGLLAQQPAGAAAAPRTHLKVGDPAPDFTLNDHNGKPFKLSDHKGKKNVVLAFYVLAFTGG